MVRSNVSGNSPYEDLVGFSRAVRVGQRHPRLRDRSDRGRRLSGRSRRRLRADRPNAAQYRGGPAKDRRVDRRRCPHADIRDRHRGLGSGRARSPRLLQRRPPCHHDGGGERAASSTPQCSSRSRQRRSSSDSRTWGLPAAPSRMRRRERNSREMSFVPRRENLLHRNAGVLQRLPEPPGPLRKLVALGFGLNGPTLHRHEAGYRNAIPDYLDRFAAPRPRE